jgi:hypothetical protein
MLEAIFVAMPVMSAAAELGGNQVLINEKGNETARRADRW